MSLCLGLERGLQCAVPDFITSWVEGPTSLRSLRPPLGQSRVEDAGLFIGGSLSVITRTLGLISQLLYCTFRRLAEWNLRPTLSTGIVSRLVDDVLCFSLIYVLV